MTIPDWWEFALLGLGAWRSFQLLAYDDILEWPRRKLTRMPWTWKEGQATPPEYRVNLAAWLLCPYCAGFWIALAWWGLWQAWPTGTLVVATPLALSGLLVGAHKVIGAE